LNPSSEDIKDWIIGSAGLGYTFATDLFIGILPEGQTDNLVAIFDSGGWDSDIDIDNANEIEKPTVKILVRNTSYNTGYSAAKTIADLLLTKFNETINSTRYIGFWKVGQINPIDYDEEKRHLFSLNFLIQRTNT